MALRMVEVQIVTKRLRGLRVELRMSQRELAKLSGLSNGFISQLEAGKVGLSEVSFDWIADVFAAELGRTRLEVKEFLMGVVGEIAHNPQYVEEIPRD
jgi:transcriptional regulator with XRE-family HTH domain